MRNGQVFSSGTRKQAAPTIRSTHLSPRRIARHAMAPATPIVANSRSWPGRITVMSNAPISHAANSAGPAETVVRREIDRVSARAVATSEGRHDEAVTLPDSAINNSPGVDQQWRAHLRCKTLGV